MQQVNWEKLTKVMKIAGALITYPAGCLWFVAIDPETPLKIRTMALGPLAYLISPLDALPDITPLIGYSDDAAVIAAGVLALTTHIKPRHKEKAKNLAVRLLGTEAAQKIKTPSSTST